MRKPLLSPEFQYPVGEGINKWGKEALLSLEMIKQENLKHLDLKPKFSTRKSSLPL